MATGAKRIETRSWFTSYRGPLLICASVRRSREQLDFLSCWEFQAGLAPLVGRPLELGGEQRRWAGVREEHLGFGRALCLVDLTACRATGSLTQDEIGTDAPFGDFSRGRFAWITTNLRVLSPPVPVTGRQGLFDVALKADGDQVTAIPPQGELFG
jgi:hypothetical protein